jgi:hypothetical protein
LNNSNSFIFPLILVSAFVLGLLILFIPVFNFEIFEEYRDNQRYSWLFYRISDESFLQAYQTGIINLGYVELPSFIFYYISASVFNSFSTFSLIIFLLNLFLLYFLYIKGKISAGSILLIITSTYFMRLSIDLHKLQISYLIFLAFITSQTWRFIIVFFHLSWVLILASDILSRFLTLPNLRYARVPKKFLWFLILSLISVVILSAPLWDKFLYYFNDYHFSDMLESLILGLLIFLAFGSKKSVIIFVFISFFCLLVGSDRILILLFLWFLTTERQPSLIGFTLLFCFNILKWFFFLSSDFNIFAY